MQTNLSLVPSLVITILIISITGICSTMAESSTPSSTSVYIVYTEKPVGDVEHESHHLSTLSSVLGSEDAAKDSLVYVYKNAATGFSAKLTPEQVSELETQPGVLQVVKSQQLKLHEGSGATTNMRI